MTSGERLFLVLVLGVGILGAVLIARHHPRSGLEGFTMEDHSRLVDQDGHKVAARDLRGKPLVMFFGFTFCPEICPTTLGDLSGWLKALGPDADKLRVVFVSVDPERDTPAALKRYLSVFDPRIRGLTGSPANVDRVAKALHVYYQKVALPNGGYTVDHSASLFLLDRSGALAGLIDYGTGRDSALTSLRALARGRKPL